MKKLILLVLMCGLLHSDLFTQTKRVLIEEGTGTWCQWCPRGFVFGKQAIKEQDALLVAIHTSDPMDNVPAYFSAANLTGLPSGNVDRVSLDIDPTNWGSATMAQSSQTPPADLSITNVYDTTSRALSITVTGDFFTALSGDYRLGAIVVEDAIHEVGPSYDQSNAYSGGGNGPMGGWENMPNPVPSSQMVYDHVARYLASDYEGDAASLPATIMAGSQHSHSMNWTLPTDHDPEYIYVIGYLTEASSGAILNANRSTYLIGGMNARPKFISTGQTEAIAGSVYNYDILTHDPDNDTLNISVVGGLPAWLNLNVTGPLEAQLTGTPPTSGGYLVNLEVSDGNSSRQQSFQINVSDASGQDWHFVGTETLSTAGGYKTDLEINSQGIPHVMYTDNNDQVIVQKFENGVWTQLGSNVVGSQFHAAMAIGPDDVPYFVSRNNGIKVYKLDNNSWTQLGGSLGDGVHIDITVAPDGTPLVSYMDITMMSRGICKSWDGSAWQTVGGGHFTASLPAVWTRIKADLASQPTVLYGTGSGNGPFYSTVSQFDGTNWLVIGGGDIDATTNTYFSHDLAFDSLNQLYVATIAGSGLQYANVYTFDGTNWQKIGDNLASGATDQISLAISEQGQPTVGFRDETNSGKSTVMRYNGSAWNNLGLAGFTNLATYQSLAYSPGGEPYLAYSDESQFDKISVKRYGGAFPVSIDQIESNQLILYPNPNHGQFVLEYQHADYYEIYDILGQKMATGILINERIGAKGFIHEFDVKGWKKGLYILWLKGSETTESVKFLIE